MKNSEKARVWDLLNYLVSELGCTVAIKYDEFTVYHPSIDHTHVRWHDEIAVEQLLKLTNHIEGQL